MKTVTEAEAIEMFHEMLNDHYSTYMVGSLEFRPSDILRCMDPIAYHQEMVNYLDSLDLEIED